MKNLPPWWRKAAYVLLFILFIILPVFLPLILFAAFLIFMSSDSGKNILDENSEKIKKINSSDEKEKKKQYEKEKKSDTNKYEQKISQMLNSITQNNNMNVKNNKNNKNNGGIFSGLFGMVAIGFIAFSVISDGFVSIPAGHTGVVFSKISGGIQNETLNPGINFKIPFLETVTVLDTRMQEKTINASRDPIEALTKDGQKVSIDITVQYKISKINAPKIVQEIGMNYEKKIVTPGVRSVVRKVITGYDSTDLFKQETRIKAEKEIVDQLKTDYENNNITLINTLVRDVKFSDKYLDAIEEKKIAEQQIQKSEFEKKNAEVQAEKRIIEAQAEATSIKLKGEALSGSPEIIQLRFVEKMAPQINWGILPDGAIPMIDVKSLSEKK